MSHLIEENANLIVLVVNSISILLLAILTALGKTRGNPFVLFMKGLLGNIILFLVLLLVVMLAYPDLAMIAILILMLQFIYFPITGIILLFISICIDINWTKNNWLYILLSFVFLFGLLLFSILYTVNLSPS